MHIYIYLIDLITETHGLHSSWSTVMVEYRILFNVDVHWLPLRILVANSNRIRKRVLNVELHTLTANRLLRLYVCRLRNVI